MVTTFRIGAMASLLMCVCGFASPACSADDARPPDNTAQYGRKLNDEERLAALDMLAKAMRENYEKIRTWKGEYHFIDRQRIYSEFPRPSGSFTWSSPGTPPQLNHGEIPIGNNAGSGYWRVAKGVYPFQIDFMKSKYYYFYDAREPVGAINIETGTEGWWQQTGAQRKLLVTQEYSLLFDVKDRQKQFSEFPPIAGVPEDLSTRVATRRRGNGARTSSGGGGLFEVRIFFDTQAPGMLCQSMANRLRGEQGEKLKLSLVQRLSIYVTDELPPIYTVISNNSDNKEYWACSYEGKAAYNCVKQIISSNHDQGFRQETTLSYRKESDIWIPEKCRLAQYQDHDGQLMLIEFRDFELLATEINEEIPDSEFDTKQMGFQYGDRMVDRLDKNTKKLYVYDDQIGFVPAEEFHFDPSSVQKEPEK